LSVTVPSVYPGSITGADLFGSSIFRKSTA
jgi:hypothetical protein